YRDADHLKRDTDLDSLHADRRWQPAMSAVQARLDAYLSTINRELYEMFREDQADRAGSMKGIDWSKVKPRDDARRAAVKRILAAGGVKVSADYFHAAMVLQHGDTSEDYDMAHKLAGRAAELDPNNGTAKWLSAAAKDRYLWRIGKPQI